MPPVDKGIRYRSSPYDWAHLRFLTRELGGIEKLTDAIAQWDATVRRFRQIEEGRFYEEEPTDFDRENHRALLHLLIGLGRNWLLETQNFTDQQWSGYGITRADLEAYIADLEDTFFMFYAPDFEPGRTAELRKAIFGANP
jgi:hypothetical protein